MNDQPESDGAAPAPTQASNRAGESKTLLPEQLTSILEDHKVWRSSKGAEGAAAAFFDCDLRGHELQDAQLAGANLQRANLEQVALQDSDLSEAVLMHANLASANLQGANCRATQFQQANLRNADLRDAALPSAIFFGADLTDANLQGTDLRKARFANAELSACDLRDSDLRDADLSEVTGLQSQQLAGSNLSGADLPPEIASFEALDHVAEISRHARTVFLGVIGGCVYSWLTISTTSDAMLIVNAASTPLPIIQTHVPITGFYWAAPMILLALFLYLHIYLLRMWDGLGSLPAVFPDGRRLDQKAYPWLMTGLVSASVPLLRQARPSLWWLQWGLAILAAWILVPFTLLAFWLRYLPKHDWVGAALLVALLLAVVWASFRLYRLAVAALAHRGGSIQGSARRVEVMAVGLAALVTLLVSYAALWGSQPLTILGYRFYAEFRGADLSTKPDGWSREAELFLSNLKARPGTTVDVSSEMWQIRAAPFSGYNLRHADASDAMLAKADLHHADLQGANLKGAMLWRAELSKANLTAADLSGAMLSNADLLGSNLSGANLQDAAFFRADLQNADLTGADLRGTWLSEARLKGADLRLARNLTQKQLERACGDSETRLPPGLTIKLCKR